MVAANSIPGNSFGITVPYHMFKTFPPEKMQRNGFFAQGGHLLFFISLLFQDNSAHFLVQSAVLGNIKYVGHSNNLRKLSHFGYFAGGFFTEILRLLQT